MVYHLQVSRLLHALELAEQRALLSLHAPGCLKTPTSIHVMTTLDVRRNTQKKTLSLTVLHCLLQGAVAVEGEAMLWKRAGPPAKMQRTSSQQLPGHTAPGQAGLARPGSHQEAGSSSSTSQSPGVGQERRQAGKVSPTSGGAAGSTQAHQDGPVGQQQAPAGTAGRAEPASSSQAGPASTGGSAHSEAQVHSLPACLISRYPSNETEGKVKGRLACALVSAMCRVYKPLSNMMVKALASCNAAGCCFSVQPASAWHPLRHMSCHCLFMLSLPSGTWAI